MIRRDLHVLLWILSAAASQWVSAASGPTVFFNEAGGVRLRTLAENPNNPGAACGTFGRLSPDADYALIVTYCSLDTTSDVGGQDLYLVSDINPPQLITKTLSGQAIGGNFFGQLQGARFSKNRRWVTFPSSRPDIVAGAQNIYSQIYLWGLDGSGVVRVSETVTSHPGIGDSLGGFPADDGAQVLLETTAVNLIAPPPDVPGTRFVRRQMFPTHSLAQVPACGEFGGTLASYDHDAERALIRLCVTDPTTGAAQWNLLRQAPNWQNIEYAFDEDGNPIEVWNVEDAARGKALLVRQRLIANGSPVPGRLYARILDQERSVNLGFAQAALLSDDLSSAVLVQAVSDGASPWYTLQQKNLQDGRVRDIPLGRSPLPGSLGFQSLTLYDLSASGQFVLLGLESSDTPLAGDWVGGASQRLVVMASLDLDVIFQSGFPL